jgi:hypothetical protein
MFLFQAPSSRHFQRELDRVKLHRPAGGGLRRARRRSTSSREWLAAGVSAGAPPLLPALPRANSDAVMQGLAILVFPSHNGFMFSPIWKHGRLTIAALSCAKTALFEHIRGMIKRV